jgi:hypothetical protein
MAFALQQTHVRTFHSDHQWSLIMDATPEVFVTLSDELLSHLKKLAHETHVPLRWLVAGLVCDTFESGMETSGERKPAFAGR